MSNHKIIESLEHKFLPFDKPSSLKDGCFVGYASMFGEVDLGNDVVEAGAFKKSLRERGAQNIRMLFQHDPDQPIGIWQSIIEDHQGLLVEGKINDEVTKGREVLSLMRDGAIDGLSIGYQIKHSYKNPKTGVRHITEIDLWEISVVTFPMLPQARINHVKHSNSNLNRSQDVKSAAVDQMMNAVLSTKLQTAKNLLKPRR